MRAGEQGKSKLHWTDGPDLVSFLLAANDNARLAWLLHSKNKLGCFVCYALDFRLRVWFVIHIL